MSRVTLAMLLLLGACGGGTAAPADVPPDVVVIEDFAFHPAGVTIPAGTMVTWSNQESGVAHTTTAKDDTWDSGLLQPGEFFRFTFEEPGEYSYLCSIHPEMQGTITVAGAPGG